MVRLVMPFIVPVFVSASCAPQYTCCAKTIFPNYPIDIQCVEELRDGSNNCKRVGNYKVWASTACNGNTASITVAEMEAREQKEREFQTNFDKFCVKNAAQCSPTETCYYDKINDNGQGARTYLTGDDTDMGPACVCEWTDLDEGVSCRANTDGSGACGFCNIPANTSKYEGYIPKADGSGYKVFHNGECACAYGPRDDVPISI